MPESKAKMCVFSFKAISLGLCTWSVRLPFLKLHQNSILGTTFTAYHLCLWILLKEPAFVIRDQSRLLEWAKILEPRLLIKASNQA